MRQENMGLEFAMRHPHEQDAPKPNFLIIFWPIQRADNMIFRELILSNSCQNRFAEYCTLKKRWRCIYRRFQCHSNLYRVSQMVRDSSPVKRDFCFWVGLPPRAPGLEIGNPVTDPGSRDWRLSLPREPGSAPWSGTVTVTGPVIRYAHVAGLAPWRQG